MCGDPVPGPLDALREWYERSMAFLKNIEDLEGDLGVKVPVEVSITLELMLPGIEEEGP